MELSEVITNLGSPGIVAGGVLRDLYFGKPVNDVDLFIPCSSRFLDVIRQARAAHLELDRTSMIVDLRAMAAFTVGGRRHGDLVNLSVDGGEYYAKSNFLSLRSTSIPGLNIILVDTPLIGLPFVEELFSTFPASLSRIAYDPKSNVTYMDKSFIESAQTKVITLHPIGGADYYRKKLHTKYPEWACVFSDRLPTEVISVTNY